MYPGLAHRRVLVTGGATGIGAAIARRLSDEGAYVAVLDVADTAPIVAELGGRAVGVPCDVSSTASVNAAVARVVEQLGGLDVVVNNAGIIGPNAPLAETSDADFTRVVDVDLVGTFRVCRAALPHLVAATAGRIVNIASIAGLEGNKGRSGYAAAKAGVIALTQSLAREVAESGVLVNAVAPGSVGDTGIVGPMPVLAGRAIPNQPLGRIAGPPEVAALVAWLCSDEVSFSTGAVYDITGGRAVY
ncbi:SDR family NAD(P)-dependent oxidoreductase [Microbispora rosea]|uniref:SDR family NAD(P)-dependent oxidoreductase n=1 Tax=Microbispora rosea TaxID=58117 RepID=UPI00343E223A